ncbi:MAG: transglutaminase protein [Frankiales bacterium]|nr:transglutaminase protein [Frankiales bacterium]
MSTRDRLTLAAALAVALACSALAPLYNGTGWLVQTLGVVLLVAAAGAAARRAGLPVLAVPLVQLLAVASYVALVFVRGTFSALLPTRATLSALRALLEQSAVDIEELAAPVPSVPSLVLVAVLGAAAVALVVDLLAVGLQRPALAGLPLLVLLAVPSGLLSGGLGWLPFTLGAAGWLGLLLVEGGDKVGRWGLPLRSASSSGNADDPAGTGRVGRRIGAAALGIAAFVPALVPGLDARLLPGSGGGDGTGDAVGPSTTVTYNPITELQGDLTLPEPRTVLRYTTDDPQPDYLRLTTLDVFDGAQWSSSSLTPDQRVREGIPVPLGTSSQTETYEVGTRVRVEALDAQWLPLPPVPSSVDVRGPWNWNTASETVFATRSSTRRAEEYTARSVRVTPDRAVLRAADAVPRAVERYRAPVDVAPSVVALTRKVTAGTDNAYDAAVALQRFFRDRDEGFRYDEKTENKFDNPDALEAFVLENRVGFCEQYASAMAVMLRVLGVPARVGVGFTPGEAEADGTRVVSTDDAHAWPEAWFEGAGWVRFEPTPVDDEREIVPTYTQEEGVTGGPSAPASGASATPSAEASAAPSGKDPNALEPGAVPLADPSAGVDDGLLPSGRTLLAGLVVVLLLAPALVAVVRRRLRRGRAGALPAWEQLHDDAHDVGHRRRVSDSPRRAAARLGAEQALPGPAVEALHRLAAGVEQERYARPGSATSQDWRPDVRTVRTALLRGSTLPVRVRALVAPPSTLRWAATGTARRLADVLDRVDDLLGGIARRLRLTRA